MKYSDALEIIIKKQSLGIKPGLERIYKILGEMNNPQDKINVIHIAGTNGKGTVASILAKSIESQGYKVGLFTSPWVIDYREQIQINSDYIPKDIISEYVEKYSSFDTTEFELITAIAYKYFFDSRVDYAVIECGMGGENDSTNVDSKPELTVITSVSLDHTNFLGKTLDDIAVQKAGIIKRNTPLVLYPNPKTYAVFENKCRKTSSKLINVPDKGNYYKNNIETVKTSLSALGLKNKIVAPLLPARQEYISQNIMLDGAHNPDGALALESNLPNRNITAVIGMMQDKDIRTYLKIIAPHCKKIITTTPSNHRAISADKLREIVSCYCSDVTVVDNPHDAVKVSDYDFLLICGSFYLARDVRKDLL